MSFRDVGPPPPPRRTRRKELALPKITVAPSPEPPKAKRKPRSFVLHGRVVRPQGGDRTNSDEIPGVTNLSLSSASSSDNSYTLNNCKEHRSSYRASLERKSAFATLQNETVLYQKIVADLEEMLKDAGESPEAAWRSRILISSAQETDKCLADKLLQYERTLVDTNNNAGELRTAQTACMKLHRDFKRSHKALVMCLSLYEKRQQAEISQLGAVGWSSNYADAPEQPDFFDRAMRQRELETMNRSMRAVNDIYQELAVLVDGQQEMIDTIDDNIADAATNAEAGAEQLRCFAVKREAFMCQAGGCEDPTSFDKTVSFSDDKPLDDSNCDWLSSLEEWKEDMAAIKLDLLRGAEDLMARSKGLECVALKASATNTDDSTVVN